MTVFFNVCCFFSHCNAHAASHHLVNDDRPVPWHQSGGDPPLATRLSTPLASSTRDRASDRAGPGCRTESARAYGGFRWLSTVPSRTVSPGHQRLDRPYNNRGGTGACLLSSGVCLCSLLQVCACVFRTRPLLHRFSAGLPGTCHGRRVADSRIEFGTNRSRLASGDRLGCADPLVGSLYGFLRIAYLIFYYGTTLLLTHAARQSSTSSWPPIGRLTPGAPISQRLRSTSSSAWAWPRIGGLAWSPATRPRATWPCGWRIISTSFATSSRCCTNWSAKPMPPLAKKTTRRTSLPGPKARPIWRSVSTSMTPRITPVSRPWHSTTNSPCCSTCCVKPCNYARLMAACAPSKTCARNSCCFST